MRIWNFSISEWVKYLLPFKIYLWGFETGINISLKRHLSNRLRYTYEDLKPELKVDTAKELALFKIYLWGFETKRNQCNLELLLCLRYTYEDLKQEFSTSTENVETRLRYTYEDLKPTCPFSTFTVAGSLRYTYEDLKLV